MQQTVAKEIDTLKTLTRKMIRLLYEFDDAITTIEFKAWLKLLTNANKTSPDKELTILIEQLTEAYAASTS